MSVTIYYKNYSAPDVNKKEVLRYALCGAGVDAEAEKLIENCVSELLRELCYKVCYACFPLISDGDELDLGFARVKSASLAKNLAGCSHIVLFAATVGAGADRLIAKYSRTKPSKAHIMQALGAERVESLCDVFCDEIEAEASKHGYCTRPRFSPGYGDLGLELQKQIFRTLDVTRKIDVGLNESLLMFPTKSVTAIVGLKKI